MASAWTGVVTNAGKALFATWLEGTKLNFDAAEGGSGTVAESALLAQTALVNKKQELSILGAIRTANGVKLTIQITAPATGYTLNQIGIKASVNGGNKVLVALLQNAVSIAIPSASDTPDFIYKHFAVIEVSNEGDFTATYDTSALVSQSTLDAALVAKADLVDGKVPTSQLPDMDYVTADEMDDAIESTLATKADLVDGKVPTNQLPDMDYVPTTRKVNNKELSTDIVLTAADVGALSSTETAASATKLLNARTIQTDLASTSAVSFDGTANITPGITGTLPLGYGGTGATTALSAALNLGRGYGTCATVASTTAKVGTLSGFVRNTGAIVGIKFTYENTAASPTLNVNSTGAAAIYDYRTSTYPVSGALGTGTHYFMFNGTQWILMNPVVTEIELSFVYNCTGTADSTAIATIVNNFFNTGTAMAMKLIITGTMGVAFTSTYYAMYITATNTRGAVCTLDFSDCHIPTITTASRDFLYVTSSTAKLNVTGLVVATTRCCLRLGGANYCNFSNCTISSTAGTECVELNYSSCNNNFSNCIINNEGSYGVVLINSSNNNSFINCTATGITAGVALQGAADNSNFSNCTITSSSGYGIFLANGYTGIATFTNCKIVGASYGAYAVISDTNAIVRLMGCSIGGGSTYAVYQSTAASTMSWYIMGCTFNTASIYVNGAVKAAATATANAYLYMPAYANFFSRTIS